MRRSPCGRRETEPGTDAGELVLIKTRISQAIGSTDGSTLPGGGRLTIDASSTMVASAGK